MNVQWCNDSNCFFFLSKGSVLIQHGELVCGRMEKMLYSKDSNVLDPRVFLTHGSIAKIYKLTIVLFCRCNSNRKNCFLMAVMLFCTGIICN